MICHAKKLLPAAVNGLVLGLLTFQAAAGPSAAVPVSLPLYFEANSGPLDVPAPFVARGHDCQFFISPAEARIMLRKIAAGPATVRMQFTGASPQAQISGDGELAGKINYLTGSDPAQWRTGVATFAKVRVADLYPGINLVYYGNQQQLEYDFTVAAGANPDAIAVHFDGADQISVNARGELVLSLAGGEIRQPKPEIYQTIGGVRKDIEGGYRMVDAHTVAFAVGKYDRTQPLVIDPLLSYSTYFGGTAGDTAWAVALNTNDGSIYITGSTFSTQMKTNGSSFSTTNAYQTTYQGGKLTGDAFVARLDSQGTNLIYLTYLGGSADDGAFSIAIDAAGDAFVAGYTDSPNFPHTTNAIQPAISGVKDNNTGFYPVDAFVAELNPGGSNLIYSTYLGGSGSDAAIGIALDSFANAYITGLTYSSNFPVTANALQKKLACTNSFVNANAFIAKIGPGGSNLLYSSYFGGANFDEGESIVVDSSNYVYITGFTASTNFPNKNAFQKHLNGMVGHSSAYDAFVAKFDLASTNLIYSSFLGGTNDDLAMHIAVDNQGAAYVTGWTLSASFPNTNTIGLYSFVVTNTRNVFATNVFLTKITNSADSVVAGTNSGIAWSVVFGGSRVDMGQGVAVDPAGNVFVVGSTSSTNFPCYPTNAIPYLRSTNSGSSDVFVTALNSNATALLYSIRLGGKQNDYGYGIAVDPSGNAYIVGQTISTNFPTLNASQTTRNGTNDSFLTKIMLTVPPPEIDASRQPISQTNWVGSTVTFSAYETANDVFPPYFFQWQKGDTNFVGTNLADGVNISGTTNLTLTINPAQETNSGVYWLIITNYGGSVTSSIALLSITNIPPAITVQPTSQTNGVGTTVTLAVTATGTAPLRYLWQVNGTNLVNGGHISGATSNVLTISTVQTTNSGNYTVIVTNFGGSVTSSIAALTVYASPVITVQPTGESMAVGANATFAVTAIGTVPLHYHWQMNGTNLANGGNISGATTNSSLIITNAQTANSGSYSVIVTNVAGSATSSVVLLTVTNIPPAITVQPTSQTNGVGTTVTLAVTATGTAPLRYLWQVNGTNLVNGGHISGATSNVLTISTVQTTNSGNYTVIVTNFGGSVTSSVAALTVYASPVITVQPTGESMAVGANATFAVTAIGTVPLHYHWQMNGTNLANGGNISGATTNVLKITSAQTTNSGSYSVIVTNVAGSATSSVVLLTVTNIPPAITSQPTSQTNGVGTTVTLAVTATGTAPLRYLWQVNGTNLVNGGHISGATSNVLTISTVQTTNSGNYTVIVTNFGGSVTSSIAALTVYASPVITVQPTGESMAVGANATFAVTAIGTVPLHYHWQMNGTNLANGGNISGATTNVLKITSAQTTNSGSYSVIVTNVAGSVTSSVVLLTVTNIPPAITVQPASQTVGTGEKVTLAVTATGTAPLHYLWQVNGTNLANGGQIGGATSNVLTISNVQTNNSGNYTVIVTNIAGSVTSSNAVLTVARSPVIITQPTNQTVGVGETVILAVTAAGTAPLSYQWQMNGTNVVDGTNLVNGDITSGSTTTNLVISNVYTNNSGSYTVIVTNIAGAVTSSNAVLTVMQVPLITVQPTSQTVRVGSTAIFGVSGIGESPFYFQWLKNGTNLTDGTTSSGSVISGSTSDPLTISNVQMNDNGNYWIVVTNNWGSATSSVAVLTVLTSPSFTSITAAGGNGGGFILNGGGGSNYGVYYVLTSTNLLTPRANWTYLATNQFDSTGSFIFTNTATTNAPQEFYLLQTP